MGERGAACLERGRTSSKGDQKKPALLSREEDREEGWNFTLDLI